MQTEIKYYDEKKGFWVRGVVWGDVLACSSDFVYVDSGSGILQMVRKSDIQPVQAS